MATDKTGTTWRGLLIQDPRISEVWEEQSNYTQADPQPGEVEAQSLDTRLVLAPAGSMTAAQSLRIQTQEPGHPGPGGGGFVWREAADGSTEYRGRDVPNVITGYEALEWVNAVTTITATKDPHIVTLSDGTLVVIYQDAISGFQRLRVKTRTPGGSWSSATTVRSDVTLTADYLPCLAVLPGDELIAAHRYVESAQDEENVRVYRSTDKGTSWSLVSTGALRTPISNDASTGYLWRRMRMAYMGGQVLLMVDVIYNGASNTRDRYFQYASDSFGGRFDQVEAGPDLLWVAFPSVLSIGTAFVVAYIGEDTGPDLRAVRVLAGAFQPFSTAEEKRINEPYIYHGEPDAGLDYLVDGDGAALIASDGALYVLSRIVLDAGLTNYYNWCTIARSYDLGETWESLGSTSILIAKTDGVWYQADPTNPPAVTTTHPVNFSAAESEGRIVVVCNHAANPGTEGASLSALYLGGASQVTMPGTRDARKDATRSTWDQVGLPWDLPGDTVWTGAGVATTEQLANARLELVCAAGETRRYSITPTATVDEGLIVRHTLEVNAGGDDAADRINIRVRLDDGVSGYDIAVRFDVAGFSVYDRTAAANVGSLVFVAKEIDIIIALGKGKVATWYRTRSHNADREWTAGPAGTVSNSGVPVGSNLIRWGVVATGAATADVYWYEWHAITGGTVGPGLHDGFTNPDDLFPAYYPGLGFKAWVDGGAAIRAADGPAFSGDEYNYDARYGFPVERIFPAESPTPRVRWRSTDTGEQQIAFKLDDGLGAFDDSGPGNDTIGFCFLGANFRTGKIQGYVALSGWTDLVTFDAAAETTPLVGGWVREGNTLVQGGGLDDDGPIFEAGEFAGGYVDMGGTTFRRIVTNTGGMGGAGGYAGKHSTIILDGVELTDPVSGVVMRVVPRNFTVLLNLLGARYAGYRVVIDAQSNPDGYFELGNLIAGWVEVFGHQYSRGRVIEVEAGAGAARSSDNVTRSRFISPPARIVELAWVEGVDTGQIWGDSASPDYIKASTSMGAEAVALTRDTPLQLAGLVDILHRQGSADNPTVVYLPSVGVVTNGTDVITFGRRRSFMAGRVDPQIRLESVLGDENAHSLGEVFRVARAIIREMV
jgi:hypothetical protein